MPKRIEIRHPVIDCELLDMVLDVDIWSGFESIILGHNQGYEWGYTNGFDLLRSNLKEQNYIK